MVCQGSSSIKSDRCPFHYYCDDEVIGHCSIGNCELDEALFEFFKKKKIKELKSSLSASELNDIRNGKGDLGTHKHEVNHGFNRVSAKYFSEVINALSVEQRKVISDYGFGSLLMYDKCVVPTRFIKWLAQHVDVRR